MNANRFALPARSRLAGLLVAALMLVLTTGVGSASAQRASAPAGTSVRAQAPAVGLLARGSGYAGRAGSPQVRALQRRLRSLDETPGPIDGLYGPRTQAAVQRFQQTHGLTGDGIAGPTTQQTLRRASAARTLTLGAGYDTPNGSQDVRALQRQLQKAAQPPGPMDGLYGPTTQAAVQRFQQTHGLTADGIAGPTTITRLHPPGGYHTPRTPTHQDQSAHRRNTPTPRSLAEPASDAVPAVMFLVAAGLIALGLIAARVWRRAERPTPAAGVPAELRSAPSPVTAADARDAVSLQGDHVGAFDPVAAPSRRAGRSNSREGPRAAAGDGSTELPVLGYVRVRDYQGSNGDAVRVHAEAIDLACEARGLRLIGVVRDRESDNGKIAPRPGLSHALERVAAGEATGLVVARLEHLTSTAVELGALMEWFSKRDARLVAADLQLDTGTDSGRRAAQTLTSVSRIERDKLAQRTRKGMAAAQADGRPISRSAVSDRPEVRIRIAAMRAEGKTLQAIADALNAEGVPTLRGGVMWRRSSVQAAAGYKRPRKKRPLEDVAFTAPPSPEVDPEGPDTRGSRG
jgi:peptidoglycan hydrolase-like protein with peptidoglycan-binding domain/DNA invertase Pin-like site-specific DNA recombinase